MSVSIGEHACVVCIHHKSAEVLKLFSHPLCNFLNCSVFWDLYCAAPERRETCEHSSEAKAFHDYVSFVCLYHIFINVMYKCDSEVFLCYRGSKMQASVISQFYGDALELGLANSVITQHHMKTPGSLLRGRSAVPCVNAE